jgi:hypothetical protein
VEPKTQRLSVGMSDGEWRDLVDRSHQTISSFPSASDVMHYRNLNQALFSGQFVSRTTQGNAMHDGSNRSLGERVHDALVEAAQAKNEAFRLERKYKRTLKAHIIIAEGKSFGERETIASTRPTVEEAEDAWVAAELIANTAKAEADGLEIQFKEWQSRNATNRAEMNLR